MVIWAAEASHDRKKWKSFWKTLTEGIGSF